MNRSEDAMYCQKCTTKLPEEAKFCGKCGTHVPTKADPTQISAIASAMLGANPLRLQARGENRAIS